MEYILKLFLVFVTLAGAEKCEIDVRKDFGAKGPLIIALDDTKFLYPSIKTASLLKFKKNEKVRVSCPGNSLLVNNIAEDVEAAEIECDTGKKFKIGKKSVNFVNITCEKHAKAIVKKIGKKCAGNGKVYDIGFEVEDDEFLPNIELCHDSERAHTYWAHGIVVSTIQSRQKQPRKNTFGLGKLFASVPVKTAYKLKNQLVTFLALFKSPKWVDQYVSELENKFFARGHLAANADGFYGDQQESTFFYANVVPMWQSVNNGNWKRVEKLVRVVAKDKKTDLNVWTGSIGTLALYDKAHKEVEIYLTNATRDGEHHMIPAPKVLFKYVYDSKHDEGLVFLTANNPYAKPKDIEDYVICEKYHVCTKILGKDIEVIEYGYTYCCKIGDFLENAEVQKLELPDFSDAKPLVITSKATRRLHKITENRLLD